MIYGPKFLLPLAALVLLVVCASSPSVASDTRICASIEKLRLDYQKITAATELEDPFEMLSHVAQVSAYLSSVSRANTGSADMLFPVIAALKRITGRQQLDSAAVSANLRRNLPGVMANLKRVAPIFGCHQDTATAKGVKPDLLNRAGSLVGGLSDTLRSASSIAIGTSAVAGLLLLIGGGLAIQWGLRDRTTRLVCRTPLLMLHGRDCTMTNILDINRSGMKVEVAPEHTDKMWFELFFCGHKTQGQVVWKNAYFAGIKFKSKISSQMLKDVIEKSRTSVAESGLQLNATPCFALGCHKNCPRHQATAISRKDSKE